MSYMSPAVLKHNEKVAATIRKAENICRKNTIDAVKLLGSIVRDPSASDADRLKAAGMIIDRVMGKAPQRIDVEMGSKMSEAFQVMLIPTEKDALESSNPNIIDAEIVEGDEEEDGD